MKKHPIINIMLIILLLVIINERFDIIKPLRIGIIGKYSELTVDPNKERDQEKYNESKNVTMKNLLEINYEVKPEYKKAYEKIKKNVGKGKDFKVVIKGTKREEIEDFMMDLYKTNEFCYVEYDLYDIYKSQNQIFGYTIITFDGKAMEQTQKDNREIKEELGKIIKEIGIDKSWTKKDAAIVINEYICKRFEYDYDLKRHTVLEGLEGKTVCSGYAGLFALLNNYIGTECYVDGGTTNTGEDHAWNALYIGDTVFYVDSTWNDVSENAYLMAPILWTDHIKTSRL